MIRPPQHSVAFFIDAIHPGGAERVVMTLAAATVATGATAWVVTPSSASQDAYPTPRGVRRVSLGPARGTGPIRTLSAARRLRQFLRTHAPDVIVAVSAPAATILALALTLSRQPALLAFQSRVDVVLSWHSALALALIRRAFGQPRRAAMVLTRDAEEELRRKFPRWNIYVVPNALADAMRKRIMNAGATFARERVVLGIGRNVPEKGWDVLAASFGKSGIAGSGWRLRLVLHSPKGIAEMVRLQGCAASTEIALWSSTPEEEYARASILVMPSRIEGFPNVGLEALASGLPIVTTNFRDGSRELFRDGLNSIVRPVDDVEGIAEALAALAADPEKRRVLSEAAQASSINYSEKLMVEGWQAAIREVRQSNR